MAFIVTVHPDAATDKTKEIYDAALHNSGYIPNYAKLFSHRPEVYEAWANLIGAIRKNLRLRRYELATIAAARKLNCTYCLLAHGAVLLKNGISEEQLIAIMDDYHHAGLDAQEVAIMEYAEKVIESASSVTAEDVNKLHEHGLSDEEILDVTLTVTARSFFSKTLDALNAVPDDTYLEMSNALRTALTMGRPFPPEPISE